MGENSLREKPKGKPNLQLTARSGLKEKKKEIRKSCAEIMEILDWSGYGSMSFSWKSEDLI